MTEAKALDVNRSLLFVTAKQPLLDWLRSLPSPFDVTLEEINEDRTGYLIPEYLNETDLPGILRALYQSIFSRELEAWWEEERAWPDITDFELFRNWFNVEAHSAVADLAPEPIKHEECNGEPAGEGQPAAPRDAGRVGSALSEIHSNTQSLLSAPELRSGLWLVSWVGFVVFNMGICAVDWALRDRSSDVHPMPGGLPGFLDFLVFGTPLLLATAALFTMPKRWAFSIRLILAVLQLGIACCALVLGRTYYFSNWGIDAL